MPRQISVSFRGTTDGDEEREPGVWMNREPQRIPPLRSTK
jgi:hypothetical protein